MMTASDDKFEKRSRDHLVDYDPINPPLEFTREQIEFIEAPLRDFSGEDLIAIRKFEWFQLNLNWKQLGYPPLLGYGAVPGLRDGPEFGTVYIRRYSPVKYTRMMDHFLEYIQRTFPRSMSKEAGCLPFG